MKVQVLFLAFFLSNTSFSQLKQTTVNDAIINYIDKGNGDAVLFIHGGLEDYRTWDAQIDTFSKKYRVISYSRRFNYPNNNTKSVKDYSAISEAADAAAVIQKLNIGKVHVVGHSFGGLIALFLAKQHPDLIKSLTLSEPALVSWLTYTDSGKILHKNFYNELWKPVKAAFDSKDTSAVLRHTLIYFAGADVLDKLPPEFKTQLVANIPEWYAITYSKKAFSDYKKKYLKEIKVPVLLLTAGQTLPLLKLTNSELKQALPNAKHFHLAEGTHDYWMSHPKDMGNAVLNFLDTIKN